ncbi:MAG: dynamin family protein [Catonella sp.]|uniref:dynamin family protein n=1 Tax=Catonella sp. TaxID=2382125 RepID=UPI003FA008AB
MNKVKIKYNPYIVETEFLLNNKKIDNKSNFYYMQDKRLQEWIEPIGDWKGLFQELFEYFNSSEKLSLEFNGTLHDFKDIEYAKGKYGIKCFKEVELVHIPAKGSENKVELLKKQFNKIVNSPIDELKDPQIREAFDTTISSEFEIVVIAPMSSGKSTLINSIIGRKILPGANQATTATITRVKDRDDYKNFMVTCKDNKGKTIVNNQVADLKLITELNDRANRDKNIDLIDIMGNIPNIPSDEINVVFVDTPGPNNAEDTHHREVMEKAIRNENSNIILFIFNPDSIQSVDCDSLLETIAMTINTSSVGKRARDRIMFVCNKMSKINPDTESSEDIIKKIKERLKGKGINEPNIFLVDALTCELIRMKNIGAEMNDGEEDECISGIMKFNRASRRLFKYAPISEEKIKEFSDEVEKYRGDKLNERVAEINSGIPALEYAITNYIEKYAQAVKIKNMHDIFMKRVEELGMKSKVEKEIAESEEKLNKTKEELEKKINSLEKDKKLDEFKRKVDGLKFDVSAAKKIKEKITQEINNLVYVSPDIVKKSEVDQYLSEFRKKLLNLGKETEISLKHSLENDFYEKCKKIFSEYQSYIREMDRNNMLNIGSYSVKKLSAFNSLTLEDLKNIDDKFNTEIVTGKVKREKSGWLNSVRRFLNVDSGWEIVDKKEQAVKLKDFIRKVLSGLLLDFLDKVDGEIGEAEKREKVMKDFVKKHLNDITATVRREFEEMNKLTHNKKLLDERYEKNKKDSEWLETFIKEVASLLDI